MLFMKLQNSCAKIGVLKTFFGPKILTYCKFTGFKLAILQSLLHAHVELLLF